MLEPDRDQIKSFAEAMFRHAGREGFVSVRAFYEDVPKSFRITPAALSGGLAFLIEVAEDDARRAANHPKRIVFCPPIATFMGKDRAKETDIAEGLALSVECDEHPHEAAAKLEAVLGPATVTVVSGGTWLDPVTGQAHDKIHLHWRLKEPARGGALARLKQARDLAAQLVGGDPSGTPVCHPLRWPGSWHRKGEPILCRIKTSNPECEIDLAAAFASLTAVAPAAKKLNGGAASAEAAGDWPEIKSIIDGKDLHKSIATLGMRLLKAGTADGAAVNVLRALMRNSNTARDQRWEARYCDIPRAVSTAREKTEAPSSSPSSPPSPLIRSSAEFVANFVPPDYVVVGLLQRRFFYSLTGATGAGKTAIMLVLAACAAQNLPFGGRETKKLRVLYLAAENADDVRMRWVALAQNMDFDIETIEVYFVEGRFTLSASLQALRAEAERQGGNFGLVIVDTGPTFFEGRDENENKQLGDHARLLRDLGEIIPGGPCIIANCHPIKHATADQLLPRGGGAFLAEVDGNLTCAKTDSAVELHWQGKFRGPDFAPMHFLIKTVTHQDLKDSDGRLIPTVIAEHIGDQAREDIAAAARHDENAVLKLINENAAATHASVAIAMGWKLYSGEPHRTKAGRCIKSLIKARLIKETRNGRYAPTPEGQKVLNGETD
jgi:AAA domain